LCVSRILAYKTAVLPTVSVIYYCATFSSSNNIYVHWLQRNTPLSYRQHHCCVGLLVSPT